MTALLPTMQAPAFSAVAVMPGGEFNTVSLADYAGKMVVLFFYPADFTFVCPSEILAFNARIDEFRARGAEVIGVSVDTHFCHAAWMRTPISEGGIGAITFPLVSDVTKKISMDYNVLGASGLAFRGLYIIDEQGAIQHILVNNNPIGRSVDEAIRIIDAVKFTREHGDVCPANWKRGEAGMKPTASGVADYLMSKF